MNLAALDVPGLLKRYGLRPDKRLGQNFLVDEAALQRVAAAGEVGSEDIVLEVGPGLGGLTRLLALQARRVVAVELDERLMPPLEEVLAAYDNVKLVQGDILSLDPSQLVIDPEQGVAPAYLVVANIPYYITSALIRHLLECSHPPVRLVLTVQQEVAERICAQPGEMSLLALSVQVYGEPQIAARIPSSAFYPAPKVDSAVVRVERYPEACIPADMLPLFFRLAKAGFSQKRKTLRNALAGGMRWKPRQAEGILTRAGIAPQRRAQTLSVAEWEKLAAVVQELSAGA